jgi:hypothetical protein
MDVFVVRIESRRELFLFMVPEINPIFRNFELL